MGMVKTKLEMQVLVEVIEFLICIDQCCLKNSCIVQQARP
jgi:hypothetical protein